MIALEQVLSDLNTAFEEEVCILFKSFVANYTGAPGPQHLQHFERGLRDLKGIHAQAIDSARKVFST